MSGIVSGTNLIKFYKKIEEQSQKSTKNFYKFLRTFLKTFTINCENVEMWWNLNRNLWKFYKKEKLFWKFLGNYN